MEIELFSDMVCPFCYIGKRRLDTALARFEHRDQVKVIYRSFQLDPSAATTGDETLLEREVRVRGESPDSVRSRLVMVTAMAAGDGLHYDLDRALPVGTFDAHRSMHYAASQGKASALAENLLRAYAMEGRSIADHTTLSELAGDAGLDPAATSTMLRSDAFAAEVHADIARARRFRISGVPSIVIDQTHVLPGVHPADALVEVLQRTYPTPH